MVALYLAIAHATGVALQSQVPPRWVGLRSREDVQREEWRIDGWLLMCGAAYMLPLVPLVMMGGASLRLLPIAAFLSVIIPHLSGALERHMGIDRRPRFWNYRLIAHAAFVGVLYLLAAYLPPL